MRATCQDCKKFKIERLGDGWNEPLEDELICDGDIDESDELLYLFGEGEDPNSLNCQGFEPILIKECAYCKKAIYLPTYMIRFSSNIFEERYFCSKPCSMLDDEKFLEMME